MSDAATAAAPVASGRPHRAATAALARLEAARTARSPWLWGGLVLTAWAALATGGADFQSGRYALATSAWSALALGVFLHAVEAGGRDRTRGALAPAAPVADRQRTVARLLGLWPALAVAVAAVVAAAVAERVEGGYWMGDGASRVDDAVHGPLELLQPIALVVLAGAVGVAAGRVTARRGLVSGLGAMAAVALGFLSWAWQWSPARYVTAVQVQPVEVDLPAGFDVAAAPDGWLLAAPDRYEGAWRRVIVSEAMAGWHSAYLLGLAMLAAGVAVRGRPGWALALAGVGVAAVGVVAQVLVAPGALAV